VRVEPDRISNSERRDLACRSHLVDLLFREIENLGNIVGPQGPSLLLKDLFDKHSLLLFAMPESKNGEITIRRNEFWVKFKEDPARRARKAPKICSSAPVKKVALGLRFERLGRLFQRQTVQFLSVGEGRPGETQVHLVDHFVFPGGL
jgi:hypothetical protein